MEISLRWWNRFWSLFCWTRQGDIYNWKKNWKDSLLGFWIPTCMKGVNTYFLLCCSSLLTWSQCYRYYFFLIIYDTCIVHTPFEACQSFSAFIAYHHSLHRNHQVCGESGGVVARVPEVPRSILGWVTMICSSVSLSKALYLTCFSPPLSNWVPAVAGEVAYDGPTSHPGE